MARRSPDIWKDALNTTLEEPSDSAAARTASQLSVFESGLDEETILVAMRELQRGAADGAPHREGPDKHGDVEDGPPPEEEPGCVYLEGSRRKADFILVYSPAKNQAVRDIFEEELLKAGLLLDYVPQNQSGLCYIKIHAPWDVLSCFAEIMRLKMPVKEVPTTALVSDGWPDLSTDQQEPPHPCRQGLVCSP